MAWSEVELERLRAQVRRRPGRARARPEVRGAWPSWCSAAARGPRPFVGVPTFLTAPHRAVDRDAPDFSGLDVAISGVPMDMAAANRPGTRFGPRAVRTIERVGPVQSRARLRPDLRPSGGRRGRRALLQPLRPGLEPPRDRGLDRRRSLAQGAVPLSVGGDHSITHADPARGRARPAGRPGAHRRAFRHRRAVRRAAREPRGAVPQRGARRRARPDPHGPDRAARAVRVSLRVRHRQRHDLHPRPRDRRDRRAGGHREGARGGAPARSTFPSTSTRWIPPSRRAPGRPRSAG